MDMIKEMQDLERRNHEEQIADYEQRAAQATNDKGRELWQDLADNFRAMRYPWDEVA